MRNWPTDYSRGVKYTALDIIQRVRRYANTIILQNDRQQDKHSTCIISAAITKAKTQDQVYRVYRVYRVFRCLCGELKVCDVRALVPGLESHHVDVLDTHWTK